MEDLLKNLFASFLETPVFPLVMAGLLGAFIGLHRERQAQGENKKSFMGLRTMTLLALYGASSTFFPEAPWAPFFFFGVISLFLLAAYIYGAFRLQRIGLTSEIAALMIFWVGVFMGLKSYLLAVILTISIAALTGLKRELHRFAGTISHEEWLGALQLLTLSGAVLPFLPKDPIDPWGVLVPFNIWFLVILISGIGFFGYFLSKYIGMRGGILLAAFLGSIVSSTAVTTSLAAKGKRTRIPEIFTAGILIGTATMSVRVAIELLIWGSEAVIKDFIAVPLSMSVAAAVMALYYYWKARAKQQQWSRHRSPKTIDRQELALHSPFELGPALQFGALFVVILFALYFGEKYWGDSGAYIAAFISGFADVDAVVLSSLESEKLGEFSVALAGSVILLATFVNTLIKIVYVFLLGSKILGMQVALGILFTCAVGGLTFILL